MYKFIYYYLIIVIVIVNLRKERVKILPNDCYLTELVLLSKK